MLLRFALFALIFSALFTGSLSAQTVGTIGPNGQAIIPSDDGDLLVINPAAAGVPVYTLVHQGGHKVVIMSARGDAMSPDEVWETFGGQAPAAPKAKSAPVHAGGTFSIPSTH
jgi:hypothetical protein